MRKKWYHTSLGDRSHGQLMVLMLRVFAFDRPTKYSDGMHSSLLDDICDGYIFTNGDGYMCFLTFQGRKHRKR